jgi:hypothetical protein
MAVLRLAMSPYSSTSTSDISSHSNGNQSVPNFVNGDVLVLQTTAHHRLAQLTNELV